MKLPLFTIDQPLKDCYVLLDCQWRINCFLHMLCPHFSWYIWACARISVSVKACRQANSNYLKLSGTESVISTASCLQYHTQENIWVPAVLAGNPDDACTKSMACYWPQKMKNKEKRKEKQFKPEMWNNVEKYKNYVPKENSEKKWLKVLLVFYDTKEFRIYVMSWLTGFVVPRILLKAAS